MNANPTISVIIPFYREVNYLKESVQSILDQDYTDFELVILDDGSPENAEHLVSYYNDPRLRYIRNENVGLANNINRSLSLLLGKYIARLDQDDISNKNRLSKQLDVFKGDPSIDCVFSLIKRFSDQKNWSVSQVNNQVQLFEPFRDGCFVNSTMMVKKEVLEALGGYRQAYYPSDDWDLELRMSQSYKIVILQENLVSYRFHENANTYRTFKQMQNTRRWAEENYFRRLKGEPEVTFGEHMQNKPLLAKIRHYLKDNSKLYTRRAGDNYLQKNYMFFFYYFFVAFIFHPGTLLKRMISSKKK